METYPLTIPPPILTSFKGSPRSHTQMDDPSVGPVAVVFLTKDAPRTFSVTWSFTPTEAGIFTLWFEGALLQGLRGFTIDLPIESGVVTHECAFLGGYTLSRGGVLVHVSANITALITRY